MHVEFVGMTPFQAKRVGSHIHSQWEILYYFNGNGTLSIGEEKIDFSERDIICQPPDIPHFEQSKQGFRNIYIHVADFDSPRTGIPCYKDNKYQDFYHILMQLYREYHLKQNNWSQIVDNLFGVLYQCISMMKIKEIAFQAGFEDPYYFSRVFKKAAGKNPKVWMG